MNRLHMLYTFLNMKDFNHIYVFSLSFKIVVFHCSEWKDSHKSIRTSNPIIHHKLKSLPLLFRLTVNFSLFEDSGWKVSSINIHEWACNEWGFIVIIFIVIHGIIKNLCNPMDYNNQIYFNPENKSITSKRLKLRAYNCLK